jgi:hypothetical protein
MSKTSSIRRRDFVAGTTAVTTGLTLTHVFAGSTNSLCKLTRADFAKLIGQRFDVDGTSEQETRQRGTMVLKAVVACDTAKVDNRPSNLRSEGFSLRFESQDLALADGTHNVAGGGFRADRVYLHEMLDQRSPGQRHYEAVFN